ncbi:MAG TPA: toll/interleukin-1 receptor domain-containing protein [Solirubrobacterales bacterium]
MSVTTDTAARAGLQKVFICYRRQETAPYAGRIYDTMVSRFGVENVFMDLDLDPGIDFVERITRVVSDCVALIVVIGPRWAQLQNEDGTRRIEDPEDFVRLEVETGLRRDDVRLIPALVGGARMPRREELPAELQGLARRNALELSEGRWAYDVGRLVETLDEVLPDEEESQRKSKPVTPPPGPPELGWRLALEGMLIAGATAFGARLLGQSLPFKGEKREIVEATAGGEAITDEEKPGELVEHIGAIVTRRGLVFALVGAALSIWLARRVWRIYPLRHLLLALLMGAIAGAVGGLIFGARAYLPHETVTLDQRDLVDLLGFAVTGGILGALIGRLWRPPRIGPALAGGAIGGFAAQVVIIAIEWQKRGMTPSAGRLGLVAAATAGFALVALIAGDRAAAAEGQAAAGSPRSGASHSGGSTGGI